jgi:dihydroorotate dehydrogenase
MSEGQGEPIDLAPQNPYSLIVRSPVLIAPGCDLREFHAEGAGATATRMATLHTRRDAPPRFAPSPAGLIVSELPTIGIRTLLKEEGRRWERSRIPVVASLQGTADECAEMAAMLESVEGVAGLLLNAEEEAARVVAFVRRQTPRPIIALLPSNGEIGVVGPEVAAAGADALVVAAAPRAAAGGAGAVEGYLLGPAVFPRTLQGILDLRRVTDVPIIALGGIATAEFAQVALDAGASAVMIDAARWGDPGAALRIAQGLAVSSTRS